MPAIITNRQKVDTDSPRLTVWEFAPCGIPLNEWEDKRAELETALNITIANVLSQTILDNASAAEQIPKDARGRFITGDGTVFQGYLFDEGQL